MTFIQGIGISILTTIVFLGLVVYAVKQEEIDLMIGDAAIKRIKLLLDTINNVIRFLIDAI